MRFIYHPKVRSDDIPSLAADIRTRIQDAIEQRLGTEPLKYGLPLRSGLRQYRKLRVGDYRVIYAVAGEDIRIIVIVHHTN